jgi:hypothetical protein
MYFPNSSRKNHVCKTRHVFDLDYRLPSRSKIPVIRKKIEFPNLLHKLAIFLFCTYNTVSITLKRVSKRSSFRYAFQEHLLKFLMLAVTHSELLLRGHCTS